jgi:hypothetical protein
MRRPFRFGLLVALAIFLVPALAAAGGGGDFAEAEANGWLYLYLAALAPVF